MSCKEHLEKEKLSVEVAEIEQRIKFEEVKAKWSRRKSFATFMLTFLSIAAGLLTLIINSNTFLQQRQKVQTAKLSQNMINLVDQLNQGTEYRRENAAILLSYYSQDAVPILLKNLERAADPEATIYSLKLIKQDKKIKPKEVITPLIESAETIFSNNVINDDKIVMAFRNYIKAIGELGNQQKDEMLKLLYELRNKLAKKDKDKKMEISDSAEHIIRTELDSSIDKLKMG